MNKQVSIKEFISEAIEAEVLKSTPLVKMACGVTNNATWLILMDAMDAIKALPAYRHRVKQKFELALNAFKAYEKALLYPTTGIPFFHLAEMSDDARKTYGAISDAQYFELWQGTGAATYAKTRPLITSLQHKYYRCMTARGWQEQTADAVAWGTTALLCLKLSSEVLDLSVECSYRDSAMGQLCDKSGIGPRIKQQTMVALKKALKDAFSSFSLHHVTKLWDTAICELAPTWEKTKITEDEQRNVNLGIEQLKDAWMAPDAIFGACLETVTDYKNVFRTVGEHHRIIRQLAEYKALAKRDMQKNRMKASVN